MSIPLSQSELQFLVRLLRLRIVRLESRITYLRKHEHEISSFLELDLAEEVAELNECRQILKRLKEPGLSRHLGR